MKKIAVINDISGFGRCSLSAALPIMSALGVQCCPLVTSVFSAQTGYGVFHHRDLYEDILPTVSDWRAKGFSFDAVMTGFVASEELGKRLVDSALSLKGKDTLLVVDPIMGDDGAVYPCVSAGVRKCIENLVEHAEVITPNLTELCLLAGGEWAELEGAEFEEKLRHVEQFSRRVSGGRRTVLTTGIDAPDGRIAVGIFHNDMFHVATSEKHGGSFSGTGDIFAAIVTAQLVGGVDVETAVGQAMSFITRAVRKTLDNDPACDRNDGIEFELLLGELSKIKVTK